MATSAAVSSSSTMVVIFLLWCCCYRRKKVRGDKTDCRRLDVNENESCPVKHEAGCSLGGGGGGGLSGAAPSRMWHQKCSSGPSGHSEQPLRHTRWVTSLRQISAQHSLNTSVRQTADTTSLYNSDLICCLSSCRSQQHHWLPCRHPQHSEAEMESGSENSGGDGGGVYDCIQSPPPGPPPGPERVAGSLRSSHSLSTKYSENKLKVRKTGSVCVRAGGDQVMTGHFSQLLTLLSNI